MTATNEMKSQATLLRRNYLALCILACLMIYQTAQNNLFSRGFTDFGHNFHIADSIIGSLLLPCVFFSLGYIFVFIKAENKTRLFELFFDRFLYIFLVWILLQNLIEVFFSGYTGSSALLGDIWFDLTYKPANQLGLIVGLSVNLVVLNLLVKIKNPYLTMSALVAVILINLNQTSLPLFYPMNYLCDCIIYVYVGSLIFSHSHHFSPFIKKYRVPIIISSLIAQYIFHGVLSLESYTPSWQLLGLSLLNILALLSLTSFLDNKTKLGKDAGIAAVILYLFHFTLIGGTREVLEKTFQYSSSIGHLVIAIAVSLSVSLFAFYFRRTFPLRLLLQPPKFLRYSTLSTLKNNSILQPLPFKLVTILSVSIIPFFAVLVFIGSEWKMSQLPRPASSQFSVNDFTELNIQEGERLANIYGCNIGCHGNSLQGKTYERVPFRGIYTSPNLTLSTAMHSDTELEQMIRQGFRSSGRPIMAGMPSAGYSTMPSEHLANILLFIRSRPTIEKESPEPRIGLLTRFEVLTGKYSFTDIEIKEADEAFRQHSVSPSNGERWARSACSECHGNLLEGRIDIGAPPLTIVRAFTYEQFEHLLRTGVGLTKKDIGLMNSVALSRFKHLSDDEIREIYDFLTAVPVATNSSLTPNEQTRNTSLANL